MKATARTLTAALLLALASCAGAGGTAATSNAVKPYTKDTCPVTGSKLDSMGNPVSFVHNGQEIKVCCQPCAARFKANPQKYLKNL